MIRMLKDANDQLERELANNKVTDITDKIRETFTGEIISHILSLHKQNI